VIDKFIINEKSERIFKGHIKVKENTRLHLVNPITLIAKLKGSSVVPQKVKKDSSMPNL